MAAGIDDIAIYIPRLYIDASDFAQARGMDPAKLVKGLGITTGSQPRFPGWPLLVTDDCNTFPWNNGPTYLIRDRDAAYERGQRARRVLLHKTAVADHVGGQDRGQTALHARFLLVRRLAAIDEGIHAEKKLPECPLLAISGRAGHVGATSGLPPTPDIRVPMSEFERITADLPPTPDVPGTSS